MDAALLERLERASWRVGTLNIFALWLRSFVQVFGALSLSMVLLGLLGQRNVRIQNETFLVAMLVVAFVSASLAGMERGRRRLLLRTLEECYDQSCGAPAAPGRTPA